MLKSCFNFICLRLGTSFFWDMPCMERMYNNKFALVHWSAAKNETAHQRWVNGGFCPSKVLARNSFVLLHDRCSGQLFSMPWGGQETVVSCANKPRLFRLACPAKPPCCAPPKPTGRGLSGLWILQLNLSTLKSGTKQHPLTTQT